MYPDPVQCRRRAARCPAFVLLLVLLLPEPGRPIYVDPAVDPNDAKMPHRYIGALQVAGPCPVPADPRWAVAPFFDAALWAMAPELERFCVYTFIAGGPVDATALTALAGFTQLTPDRMAIAPAGTTQPTLERVLEQRFLDQIGWVPVPRAPDKLPTRLALLDTSPDPGANPNRLPERSPHGQTLRRLLERLSCSEESCLAQVSPRLAMGYVSHDFASVAAVRDPVRGGHFGSIGELAEAIAAELLAWNRSPPPRPRLVLNLSLAWDPMYGGEESDPKQMEPDVEAVFRALEAASCQGAIPIAAAGNADDRRGEAEGPMLPAAWASRVLPGGGCRETGPMLFAVGAVDRTGAPLVNARHRSAPPLAAFGDHATVSPVDPHESATPSLTGSSVAAAVVSATVAAVAHHFPELPRLTLMNTVLDAGDELDRRADVCVEPMCANVRKVSYCAALEQTSATHNGSVSLPACPERETVVTDLTAVALGLPPIGKRFSARELDQAFPTQTACAQETPLHRALVPPDDPCPRFQRFSAAPRPWTMPQPNDNPCPNCLVIRIEPTGGGTGGSGGSGGNGLKRLASSNAGDSPAKVAAGGDSATATLFLALDPDIAPRLQNPTLVLCPGDGARAYALGPIDPWTTLVIDDLPLGNCDQALLSFTLTSGISYSLPLLVGSARPGEH